MVCVQHARNSWKNLPLRGESILIYVNDYVSVIFQTKSIKNRHEEIEIIDYKDTQLIYYDLADDNDVIH